MAKNHIYRWGMVAARGLLGCVAIGAMFSLPVFLLLVSRETGWSMTGISAATTIGFIGLALASPFWDTLSDRLGPHPAVLTNFFCCATHSGPIFHTVSFAVTCGIPVMAAATIYSLEGLARMGGHIAFGLLADRLGAKRVLVWGLFAQAFGAVTYAFARDLASFYAAAMIFDFIYGGIMPFYAVIIRENFPLRMMGTVIGGTTMPASLGMASGPVTGGLIQDITGSYVWLYVGSFALGIGAFLIALTSKPFQKRKRSQQRPNEAGVIT